MSKRCISFCASALLSITILIGQVNVVYGSYGFDYDDYINQLTDSLNERMKSKQEEWNREWEEKQRQEEEKKKQQAIVANAKAFALADEVLSKIITKNMTTDNKVRAVYDFLMFNCVHIMQEPRANNHKVQYNRDPDYSKYINNNYTQKFPINVGLLVTNEGVCDNFAGAFAFLLGRMGIPAEFWGGNYVNRDGSRMAHAFNRAMVDGKWYWYDVDVEGTVFHRDNKLLYFLYKQTDFSSNHADMVNALSWERLKPIFDSCPVPFAIGGAPANAPTPAPAAAPVKTGQSQAKYTSAPDVSVFYNGKKIVFDEPPVRIGDYVLIQSRPLFDALGFASQYYDKNGQQYIDASKNGETFRYTVNSRKFITIDNNADEWDNEFGDIYPAPCLINGRFYIPALYISCEMGVDRQWDESARAVLFTDIPPGDIRK